MAEPVPDPQPDAPAPASEPPAPAAKPPHRRGRRVLGGLAAALALVAAAGVLGGWWLAATEPGLRALLGAAARLTNGAVQADDVHGSLIGAPRVGRLALHTPGARLELDRLAIDWDWRALRDRTVSVSALAVGRLRVVPVPDAEPPAPPQPPASLRLPVALRIERLTLDELVVESSGAAAASGAPPGGTAPAPAAADPPALALRDIALRVGSDGATRHRIDALRMRTPWGEASGAVTLGAQPPFALQARAVLDGRFALGEPAVERTLRLRADADGTLERLALAADASGALAGQVQATLRPFAPVPIEQARVRLQGVDPADWKADLPRAALTLQADLALADSASAARPGRTDWRDWAVQGPVEIVNAAPGPVDAGRLPVRRLAGQARWEAQRLALDALRVDLPGAARLDGQLQWSAQDGGRIEAWLQAAGVDAQALHGALQPTRLSGPLRLDARPQVQSLQATLTEPRFGLEVDLQQRDGRVTLHRVRLGAQDASLQAAGWLDLAGARAFSLDGKLAGFDPSVYADVPRARLDATLSAAGRLQGAGGAPPQARLRFALGSDSRLDGRPLSGQGRLQVEGSRLADADVDLDLAGNRLLLRGAFGRPGDALVLDADAPRLDGLSLGLGGALKAQARVTGTLQDPAGRIVADASRLILPGDERIGRLHLDANLERGADGPIEANLALQDWKRATTAEPAVARVAAALRGTLREHVLEASAQAAAAGSVSLRARGGLQRVAGATEARAADGASGNRPTPTERASAGDAAGLVGALLDGTAQWRGAIERLDLVGTERVRLLQPAALAARRDAVRLEGAVLDTSRGRASLALVDWTPQALATRGSLDAAGLPPELLRAAPGVRSTLRLDGRWDLRVTDEAILGTVRIARRDGDIVLGGGADGATPFDVDLALGLSALRLELDGTPGRVAAMLAVQGARVGTLAAQGAIVPEHTGQGWRAARDGAIEASAELSVPDLEWVGSAVDPGVRTGGSLAARLRASGTARAPIVAGTVDGNALRVRLLDQGIDLVDGRVRLAIDESLLTLREAVFSTPVRQRPRDGRLVAVADGTAAGTLRASGSIRIAGEGAGQGLIRVQADRFAALQAPDRWVMLSGSAAVTLEPSRLHAEGTLRADAAYVELGDEERPTLGSDVVVVRRVPAAARGAQSTADRAPDADAGPGATARPDAGAPLSIDLAVDLGERFYVRGRGLEARLDGTVRVRGRVGGTLLASGSVRTVDGTFSAYNQRLTIERGVVNFQGPIENPGLNVRAMRRGPTVEAGVEVTGTVQEPRVKLVSVPEVPDQDKLSWLVLGYSSSQLSGREQELLGSAALALLSGQRGGGAGSDLLRSLGVDVGLRSTPTAAPGSATLARLAASSTATSPAAASGRIVTVGRRLSSRAYLGIEQSLTGTRTIVQITYQLSRRLSAVARTGAENALDLIYSWSFR